MVAGKLACLGDGVDDAAALAHVHAVVRRSGTSFYWAMKLLPPVKRDAMFAIYAYCREVDDIADADAPGDEKLRALEGWAAELDDLYAGRPATTVGRALVEPVARYGLRKEDFVEVLRGMETDARGPIRAPSLDELETYCARVAGAVGLLSMSVFECPDRHGRDFALATGSALQLTNILRDVVEDAADGRLYLPRELLRAAGIDSDDPAVVLADPRLPEVCAALAGIARARFARAGELLSGMNADARRAVRPAVIMAGVYRHLFERMDARGWDRFDRPVRMSKFEKLWIALRVWVLGR